MNLMKKIFIWIIGGGLSISGIKAQQLPIPRNIEEAYTKGTRATDGKPGRGYWQNKADYKLNVQFYPDTRLVAGRVEIDYVNNSPDTLDQIWFKLYPNLYKKGTARQSSVKKEDLSDGLIIDSMWINNKLVDQSKVQVDGTNMVLSNQSLLHAHHLYCNIKYHYTLNKKSHIRTGEIEPNADFVAYFFPRIAVYDDIDGWNKFPYNGSQEFYNDFCNFDVNITVPRNFIVWATGDLLNASDVLAAAFVQRLSHAAMNDEITTIIDVSDIGKDITAKRQLNTWHFTATDVTDFVFATSNHYIWKSSSLVVDPATKRRTRVDAVFNPKHKDYFNVIDYARQTVQAMSYTLPNWPFPYSHETVVDGLDQMEYPMMVNDNPLEKKADAIELTDHEIFHTMFPFYMGINETKYGWMDEGWATLGEWLISPMIDSTIVDRYGVKPYEMAAATESDLPIMTLTTQQTSNAFFLNSYPKPAFGYLYIKDMLGDSLFTRALHHYIETWHGKHPMPFDFFNCMNAGSGKNLNWFWKRWYFDNGYPDLSITSVAKKGTNIEITITSKGSKPVPVDLTITYADHTVSKEHRTIAVWEQGDTTVSVTVPSDKPITKVELGSTYTPDVNKRDNIYQVK
jgi:hypothetical protein